MHSSFAGEKKTRPSPLTLLLVLVAAFALAATTFMIASREPGDRSAEAGFARDMMVHHAQAVEMAEILRDKTENAEMRTMAADIALTQQGQIGQMQGWLAVWGLPITSPEPAMSWMGHPEEGRMPGMVSPGEINTLRKAPAREAERRFLQLMIPHHQAALEMSDAILERSGRPEVRRLATAIKESQESEIKIMKQMLEKRGASPQTKDPRSMLGMQDHGG